MLKWTINGTRQSYLQTTMDKVDVINFQLQANNENNVSNIPTQNSKLKRKSCSDCYLLQRQQQQFWNDTDNQMTSTPLHHHSRNALLQQTIRKVDSLKDLSDIVVPPALPPAAVGHRSSTETLKRSSTKPQSQIHYHTPEVTTAANICNGNGFKDHPKHYASTLPTFNVEYSPCALVPGPILALRGLGIADTYFEKPRYLTEDFHKLQQRQQQQKDRQQMKHAAETMQQSRIASRELEASKRDTTRNTDADESSLSSSKMGDTTLERMIDSILESTCKERKFRKSTKQYTHPAHHAVTLSPTYTRAYDPANDLHEIWERSIVARDEEIQKYSEREVCSPTPPTPPTPPSSQQFSKLNNYHQNHITKANINAFQLKRQRAVRRKRKLNKFTTLKNSAQKLLGLGSAAINVVQATTNNHKLIDKSHRKTCCNQYLGNVHSNDSRVNNNISPDSGHNSASDTETVITIEQRRSIRSSSCDGDIGGGASEVAGANTSINLNALDATKRRLSFSNNNYHKFT